MLKDKELLDQELTEEVSDKGFDLIEADVVDYMYDNHNIPKDRSMDYITLRRSFGDADAATEYALIEAIIEVGPKNAKSRAEERLMAYFTALERGKFSKWKAASKSIPKQFRIPCIQVSDNQWIGAVDVHFFVQLRDAQKIRYNENAQRIMKRVNRGEEVEYTITINWSEVKDIQSKYRNEQFIPNALTLNIPEDVDTDFHYDPKAKELVFDDITVLDITDGYHRYLAATAEYDRTDGEFNYPVEIRIIQFSDKKARDFVYQETLGLKMKKSDAQAMSSNSNANFIVDKINEGSNLEGLIKRNGGYISYSDLSYALNTYFFNTNDKYTRAELVVLSREIIKYINKLTSAVPELLDKTWQYSDIVTTVFLMKYYLEARMSNINFDLEDKWTDLKTYINEAVPKRSLTASRKIPKIYLTKIEIILSDLPKES